MRVNVAFKGPLCPFVQLTQYPDQQPDSSVAEHFSIDPKYVNTAAANKIA